LPKIGGSGVGIEAQAYRMPRSNTIFRNIAKTSKIKVEMQSLLLYNVQVALCGALAMGVIEFIYHARRETYGISH